MEVLGSLVHQMFAIEMVFFDIRVTFGQVFIFTWLSVLVIGFIKGLFD